MTGETVDDIALSKEQEAALESIKLDVENDANPAPAIDAYADADDAYFQQAEEELKAEEAAKAAAKVAEDKGEKVKEDDKGEDGDTKADEASAATQSKAPEGDKAKSTVMIPKPRLDEVLKENSELREALSFQKGVAETRAAMLKEGIGTKQVDTDASKQVPTKTVADVLNEINAERIGLAEKFDAGEVTLAEMRKQEIALENKAEEARSLLMQAKINAMKQEAKSEASRSAMQVALDDHAKKLDADHPHMAQIKDPAHWDFLRNEAAKALRSQGVNLDQNNPRSQMVFREKIAELSDYYAPIWTGQPVTKQTQQETVKSDPSKIAAQRAAKLDVSARQPPETSSIGTQGTSMQITAAEIVKMTDDQIADLPAAVRDKFLR